MKCASVFILAFCFSSSVFCELDTDSFEKAVKDGKEAVPVVIDWAMQKMREYPQVPGILTAAFLSKLKESFRGKRSSFLVWATVGATVLTEPYRLFATEYLVQRSKQKKEGTFVSELTKAKESAEAALASVKLAVNRGSHELKERATQKIDEITGTDSK
jgi:uncharacterized protein YegP (UPF0339 family)